MLANLRKAVWRSASHRTPKDSLLDAKTCVRPRFRRIGESRKRWTEGPNAGIHEDAFFVGGKMFMHIHSHSHCDIRLAKSDQERILAEGKARPHRWAPEQGYVTFMTRDEKDLAPALELIHLSHDHF